jgi:hypothetical protein
MSIITITSALQGAMFTLTAEEKTKAREIPVGKGVKAAVVLAGHLSAQDVRQPDGSYSPGAFGRLPIECAVHDGRYIISVAGGLRGTLFKMTEEERTKAKERLEKARNKAVSDSDVPYYNGDLEVGGGRKVWLSGFVREVGAGKERPQGEKFISLQTGEEKAERQGGAKQQAAADALPM